jgi:predicted Rossmann-fold nucleotide-binding protein
MDKVFETRYQHREKEYELNREIVTVFSSVSNEAPSEFKKACRDLGEQLSKENYKISYGGSQKGCSKWLIDGVEKSGKGDVRAVKYAAWPINDRVQNPKNGMRGEVVKTGGPDLFMRMTELRRDAMACVVLPGGASTMEEMWNAIVASAEFKPLPVILVNINGFFDPAKEQMKSMANYFYWPRYQKYVLFASSIPETIQLLNAIRYLNRLDKEQEPYMINARRMARTRKRKSKHTTIRKTSQKTRKHR